MPCKGNVHARSYRPTFMAPGTHPFRCPDTTIDSFFVLWFFRLLLPSYHDKKKLKTVLTFLIKFFLIISISPWAQPSLSNLQELKEKAPFRGWGVGERVRSGLSAALSLWIAPVGRKFGRKRGASCRRFGISKRKPPLGGGGWACECAVVYPLRSRKETSGTQRGGG